MSARENAEMKVLERAQYLDAFAAEQVARCVSELTASTGLQRDRLVTIHRSRLEQAEQHVRSLREQADRYEQLVNARRSILASVGEAPQ